MTKEKKMTMNEAIGKVFSTFTDGQEFYGWEIKKGVVELLPEKAHCYEDTVMRVARKFYRDRFRCVNPSKSKYTYLST